MYLNVELKATARGLFNVKPDDRLNAEKKTLVRMIGWGFIPMRIFSQFSNVIRYR
jgi:hypothetical protein